MATPDVNLRTGNINTGKVTAAKLASDAVETAKIKDANVTTGKLATKAVTGVKLDETAFKFLAFTGKNGAGACTLTGAKVGDKVIGVMNWTDGTNDAAKFESTITVADQIQQSDAGNLSTKGFFVLLVVKS